MPEQPQTVRLILRDASKVIDRAMKKSGSRQHPPQMTEQLRDLRVPATASTLGDGFWLVDVHTFFESIQNRNSEAFWYWLELYFKERPGEAKEFLITPEDEISWAE